MEIVQHHQERERLRDARSSPATAWNSRNRSVSGSEDCGAGASATRRPRLRASRPTSPPYRVGVIVQHRLGSVLDQLRADRDPRLIRRRQILRARTPAHREPIGVRAQRRVRRQPRLPDPRLARQQHQLTRTRPRRRARLLQHRSLQQRARRTRPAAPPAAPLATATGQPPASACSGSSGSHTTRERLHRLRDPLQLQLPDRLEPRALYPPRRHLRHRRHEDPVRRRLDRTSAPPRSTASQSSPHP